MPLLTELDLIWVLELQRCRAYGAEKMSREGREGGEGFFMDKIFDKSKINLIQK
jgi:hypothetical protein